MIRPWLINTTQAADLYRCSCLSPITAGIGLVPPWTGFLQKDWNCWWKSLPLINFWWWHLLSSGRSCVTQWWSVSSPVQVSLCICLTNALVSLHIAGGKQRHSYLWCHRSGPLTCFHLSFGRCRLHSSCLLHTFLRCRGLHTHVCLDCELQSSVQPEWRQKVQIWD